jgi:hypothetical protein
VQALLYANLTTRKLSESPGGADFDWPELIEGDTLRLALRFTETLGEEDIEIDPDVRLVRASLGRIDARPTGGRWAIQIGSDSPEEGVNTTALIEHNASNAAVQAAVQALLASVDFSLPIPAPDTVTVEAKDGSWLLRFQRNGEPYPHQLDLRAGRNALDPISFVRSRAYQIDGEWIHELRLVQAPVAFTDTSARIAPDAPSITVVREGGIEGEIEWNEVQALNVPPQFRGAYQIKRPDTFAKSALLSVGDGIEEITTAIQPLADEDGQFNVTNPLTNVAHIEFAGAMGGIDQDPLVVEVVTAPPGDVTFDLTLATAEIANLLRSAPLIENLPLEIEVTYAGEDEFEPLRVWTYRTEITLRRELIHDELATERNIDWLRPPLPADYVPFTPDQIITGNQHHVTTFGNGISTAFVIDHHLGTEAIHLTIRENTDFGAVLRPGSDYEARMEGPDSVRIAMRGRFASRIRPPRPNSLAAVITSAGPKSAFQAHTHTIAQIVGLQTILDAFGADIAQLKALAPAGALASQTKDTGFATSWTLPKLFEVYPTRKPVTATKDFAALIEAGDAALPRASGLLAAVHDAVAERLPTPLPAPDRTYIDRVFENRGTSSVALPGGLGRRSVDLAPGQFAACDGRVWYRVEQVGAGPESSFYPSDFTRELFRLFVNDKQLRLKTELSLQFAIELAVLKSNTNCQWVLVIELGTAPQDTAPGATGINLQNVIWSPTPVLQQRIIVTPAPCTHVFGIRVKRFLSGGAEVITLDQILYGSAEGGIAPASANFAARGRLVRFDTENNQSDPRGFIALRGLDLPEGENQELPDIGKAIIRN